MVPGTGLLLCEYRPYSLSLGRWTSRDPIGEKGDLNLYRFVDNAAISTTDLMGLYSFQGCSEQQEGMVRKTFGDFCKQAKACAPRCSLGAITLAVNRVCDDSNNPKPRIICVDDTYVFPDGKKCTDNICGREINEEIFLCPKVFDPEEQDKFGCPRNCVLFHEAIHTFGPDHGVDMTTFDNCMGCTPQPESK